jgi:Phage phiEco32-like COOH.NH2 ligase-type 2
MKIELIAVGADPELFLRSIDTGKPVSSEGLIGGSKAEPKPIPNAGEGYAVQEDNVAVEFNIPPARNSKEFASSIAKAIAYCDEVAKRNRCTLSYEPALHFTEAELSTPHARRLGCDPDFNAWTLQPNNPPQPPATMRTAAGHVHVSWHEPTPTEQAYMVKALDLFLGVPSILATPRPISDANRRSLYGRAGACRPKPYGVEHRTLDNFWVENHRNRIHVFNQVKMATLWLSDARADARVELDNWSAEIQDVINFHDKDLAIYLMSYFELEDFPVRAAC